MKAIGSKRKAVGCIRVSTDNQVQDGVSLEAQREKVEAYANLNDFDLVEVVSDEGISAKNLNRPGIQKILEMAERKEMEEVVVFKLDRMFRSTVDALEVTQRFAKLNIGFHSISEKIDTQSAIGGFFFTLIAALGEMERKLIGERTKMALAHKKSKGEKTGGDVPFGYDVNADGCLIQNEAEQSVIDTILELREKGYSLRGIGRELDALGHKTKKNAGSWNNVTIGSILNRVGYQLA
jgi:DNA invertase Pin-like site-specific DNA recombinase